MVEPFFSDILEFIPVITEFVLEHLGEISTFIMIFVELIT